MAEKEIVFPKKYIEKATGMEVLFINETTGIVTKEIGEKFYKTLSLGVSWDGFTPCTNTDVWEPVEENETEATGSNDGSKNSFYDLPAWVTNCDRLAEYLELDPYEFNILKTLWVRKGKRHDGTNEKRELNKRLHYAKMSLEKFERKEKRK